ncbi:TetR/AcrR family transcriptional regulator [Sphingomonas sp. SM33]|uniref:TetR/AcrR family transcriptional regulator n=1 Tax=Sphingomonas telluris TaxID=2907998 RepID=A0ABS9VR67_9SPHN|nr:TetR/AcrR family transcriptional regulator [Sphingomonas telluris]
MARVRTDEKRREIVKVASELFEQNGFDRTSMSMISDRLGGSKATLYGYFKSKDELFQAVVDYDVPEQSDRLMQEFFSGKDLKESFTKLGIAFLTRLLSPTPIANMRMMANRPEGSEISRTFYNETLRPAWGRLAERIEAMMDEGLLKRADPWVAAMQWKGLNEWDLLDRRLLGIDKEIDPAEIRKAATTAAEAFLILYAPDTPTRKAKRK